MEMPMLKPQAKCTRGLETTGIRIEFGLSGAGKDRHSLLEHQASVAMCHRMYNPNPCSYYLGLSTLCRDLLRTSPESDACILSV